MGESLMRWADQQARALDCWKLTLHVEARNRAIDSGNILILVQKRGVQEAPCVASYLADGLVMLSAYIWYSWVFLHDDAFTPHEQWNRVWLN